ncbi:epidermal growth factor receptor kinase substrate 8-like [Saccoglossus kowalevskii]|uniref:Epidermal growth factor receptor kinase substrate 8-like n=1 Tax=Saccoglossus kowalevskii TaxID=10224 RepID=A0ABM0MFM0_SACKO|nr:PREDICTED: epidermal growth factor receptor kinase substrate 8-like [Saccoglossus kowalevskii]
MPVYAAKRHDPPMDMWDDSEYSQHSQASNHMGMPNGYGKQNGYVPNGYVSNGPTKGAVSAKDIYARRKQYTDARLRVHKPRRNATGNEGPEMPMFPVEHLATFSVDRKDAVLTVEDSIRKLKLMDAKGKIWSQEMTLQITDREIILVDNETQETLENFPLNTIIMTTAVINECNYNSVLVFSCKDHSQKTPDMHLFQCDHIQADVIAAELQSSMEYATGKNKQKRKKPQYGRPVPAVVSNHQSYQPNMRQASHTRREEMMIPPPPNEPAPSPPDESGNVRSKVLMYSQAQAQAQKVNGNSQGNPMRASGLVRQMSVSPRGPHDEDSVEMLAMRTERDVEILNHCFSDVEAFVAKLQKAADAFNELSKRRKTRKNKIKQPGDGVLQARSRPPSEDEYVDVFQKIKYAFNLLAKLKAHIHDPNSPELVHFMFTPLELIVQSCNGPELARSVLSPLLTVQAVELLRNCLTSREGELWVSLGTAWTTPKAAWPKDHYVAQYVPKFRDGWEPPVVHSSHIDSAREEISAAVAANAAAIARAEEVRRAQKEGEEHVFQFPPPSGANYSETYYARHIGNGRTRSNQSSSPTPGPHSAEPASVAAFKANVAKHVDRNKEAHARVKQQTEIDNGRLQYHQHQPVLPPSSQYQQHSPPTQSPREGRVVDAKYDFVARNQKELTIMAGEVLEVVDDSRMWWCVRNSSGQTGFVPSTILDPTHANTAASSRIPSPPPQSPPPPPLTMATGNNQEPVYHHHLQQRAINQTTVTQNRDSMYSSMIPKQPPPQQQQQLPQQHPAPPPPPPPLSVPPVPPPTSHYAQSKKTSRQSSIKRDQDNANDLKNQLRNRQALRKTDMEIERAKTTNDLHEELKRRVNQGPKRNFQARQRAPPVNINPDSNPDEVTNWLLTKGFSKLTVDSLGVLTGAQLFSLTKEELKQVCYEDGSRVYSQLMVQKSRLEDSLNGSAELQAIMQRRKERANSGSDIYDDTGILHQPPPDFAPATPPGYAQNSSGDNSPGW